MDHVGVGFLESLGERGGVVEMIPRSEEEFVKFVRKLKKENLEKRERKLTILAACSRSLSMHNYIQNIYDLPLP